MRNLIISQDKYQSISNAWQYLTSAPNEKSHRTIRLAVEIRR